MARLWPVQIEKSHHSLMGKTTDKVGLQEDQRITWRHDKLKTSFSWIHVRVCSAGRGLSWR